MLDKDNSLDLPETMRPGISVITAVGPDTTEEQLYRCLESVAQQSCACKIEHVVVFDGAKPYANLSDTVREVALALYSGRETQLVTKVVPWAGPGATKMQGLQIHRYKYVAFLDSDDTFYDENSLDALYTIATATDVDIVQGSVALADGRVLLDPYDIEKYGVPTPVIVSKREIFERCQVFKRANVAGKLFDCTKVKLKYNIETDMCDDVYGVVEAMYNANTVAVVPDMIYVIFDNVHSVSKSSSYGKLLAIRQYAKWAQEFAKEHCLPLPDKYYRIGCYDFTLFGKRFMRIDKWEYRTRVYLFGKLIWEHQVGL